MQNPQYAQLASRLSVARRAYKRMTVMAGAVVFLIEALGTIAIVIAADVMFDLAPAGRIGLFLIAAATLVYFAIRHIGKPLTRSITDQQLALYLEQRSPQFEGALIAATEFGPGNYTGTVAQIVDSILDQAVARAGKFDLRKAIDLARLKKYGVVAAILLAMYGVAVVTMPQATKSRFARVFTPWKKPPVEVVPGQKGMIVEAPLLLNLAAGDTSLVRGGTLQMQASASRRPHESLSFHFRSLVPGSNSSWKMLPMNEIEQVNTYQLTLPDVNEDLEYFVAAENVKSEPHHVTVFDPLLIKSYEVATKYPAYLKFPDRNDKADTADLTVPQGSQVTLRILTNGAVASGKLEVEGRDATPITVDTKDPSVGVVTIDAQTTTSFKLSVTDAHGQTVETPTAMSLNAVPDAPPTIKLITPATTVNANPLAEIPFVAEVGDDLALGSAALVITRGTDPAAKPARFPIAFDSQPAEGEALTAAKTSGMLMLEKIEPALTVGESVSCYVEVTDRKGQPTPSDLVQIVIVPFEAWAAYVVKDEKPSGGSMPKFFLPPVLQALWRLNGNSAQLAPKDFNRQLEELAKTMVDNAGALHPYFVSEDAPPDKVVHGERAMQLAKAGHDAMVKHDAPMAIAQLRAAVAELALAGVLDVIEMHKPPESKDAPPPTASEMAKSVERLKALMADDKPAGSAAKGTRSEKDDAEENNKETAEAEAIEKEQNTITEKIKKAAAGAADAGKKSTDATADDQDKLAKKTEAAAKKLKDAAGADENKKGAAGAMAGAAGAMKNAADALKKGDKAEAQRQAEAASRGLAAAKGALQTGSQDAVNNAISKAQETANSMAAKQADITAKTEAAGKAPAKDKKAAAGNLAAEQVKLKSDAKALADAVDGLAKAGEGGGLKPDTNKHIQDAKSAIAKSRLQANIDNAAVNLAAGDTAGAAAAQKKVKDALDAIGKSLENASGTRAGNLAGAIKRAKTDAAEVKKNLVALKDAASKEGAGAAPGADAKGKAGDAKKPGEDAKGKAADAKKPGEDAKGKAGDAPGKAPGKGPAMGAEDKKALAQKTAADLANLAKQMKNRDLGKNDKGAAAALDKIASAASQPGKMTDDLENSPAKIEDLEKMTATLQEYLESEYQSTLKSQELFAAQREDCPPQYRPLVNRYFESISSPSTPNGQ